MLSLRQMALSSPVHCYTLWRADFCLIIRLGNNDISEREACSYISESVGTVVIGYTAHPDHENKRKDLKSNQISLCLKQGQGMDFKCF